MKAPRRAFLGAVALSPLGAAPFALAEPVPAEPAPVPAPPEPSVAEGLLVAARARFGHHLGPGEVEEVGKGIAYVLRAGDKLRAHPLLNAEAPVGVFEARPAALRDRAARTKP